MEIKHRGYIFRQSDYNHHVTAFQDGHMVYHASVTKPMSEQEFLEYADKHQAALEKSREKKELREKHEENSDNV